MGLIPGYAQCLRRLIVMKKYFRAVPLIVFLAWGPASAQILLDGEWAARYHEDQPERIPGPELGDYLGMPINDAARLRAESWDAVAPDSAGGAMPGALLPYILSRPSGFAHLVGEESGNAAGGRDPQLPSDYSQNRTIWMDGRPHPPA